MFLDDLQNYKDSIATTKPSQVIGDTSVAPDFVSDLQQYQSDLPSVSQSLAPAVEAAKPPELTPQLEEVNQIKNQEDPIDALGLVNQELGTQDQIVSGTPVITQRFGARSGVEVFSKGINRGTDFGVPENTKVAVPEGEWEVMETFGGATKRGRIGDGTNKGYGNSVLVRNKKTGETLRFSHLNRVGVKPGQVLSGGTIVGLSGATGNVTGPHVDIEYTNNGKLSAIEKSRYAPQLFGKGGGNPVLTLAGLSN